MEEVSSNDESESSSLSESASDLAAISMRFKCPSVWEINLGALISVVGVEAAVLLVGLLAVKKPSILAWVYRRGLWDCVWLPVTDIEMTLAAELEGIVGDGDRRRLLGVPNFRRPKFGDEISRLLLFGGLLDLCRMRRNVELNLLK